MGKELYDLGKEIINNTVSSTVNALFNSLLHNKTIIVIHNDDDNINHLLKLALMYKLTGLYDFVREDDKEASIKELSNLCAAITARLLMSIASMGELITKSANELMEANAEELIDLGNIVKRCKAEIEKDKEDKEDKEEDEDAIFNKAFIHLMSKDK